MKSPILISTLSFAVLLCGCATNIQSEDGLHTATKMGVGTFDDPYLILSEVREDASRLCAKTGQVVGMATPEALQGIPSVIPARATLKFRCVSP